MDLPWRQFVPVKRASVDESARALDPKAITQFGLVLSRFDFNGLPNSHYKPGNFSLQVLPHGSSTDSALQCTCTALQIVKCNE